MSRSLLSLTLTTYLCVFIALHLFQFQCFKHLHTYALIMYIIQYIILKALKKL